jgi:membrane protein implicated in regulation of membrane protease activity
MQSSNVLSYFWNWFAPQPEVPVTSDPNLYRALALGEIGVVTETIYPQQCGRVEYRASWWEACCPTNTTIMKGTRVRVIETINITLVVVPLNPPTPPQTLPKLENIQPLEVLTPSLN